MPRLRMIPVCLLLIAVPAIDTHDHLQPFNTIPGRVATPDGKGMTL